MKKRALIVTLFAACLFLGANHAHAEEKASISNGGFEKPLEKNATQTYKAERVTSLNGKVHSGNFALKIGNEAPDKTDPKYPLWQFNGSKGSVNQVVKNVKPNTQYKISMYYFNESGADMRLGVLDTEGSKNWKSGQLNSVYHNHKTKSTAWEQDTFTITTGPRTTELYLFALTNWSPDFNFASVFYVDDFSIEEVAKEASTIPQTIDYNPATANEFPLTMPLIKNFVKSEAPNFKLNKNHTDFYATKNTISHAKTLAQKLKQEGLIKSYSVKLDKGKNKKRPGIYITEAKINYALKTDTPVSRKEAYEINISQEKVEIHSSHLTGVQNGTMTLLQALRQRDWLPAGTVEDYTDQEIRGLQVDSGRRYYSMDWLKKTVDEMAELKMNKLQLRLKDNEGIRYESKVAPQFVDTYGGYWTASEIHDLVRYARARNIEVIPEVDLPGHSEQDGIYFDSDWLLNPGEDSRALDFSKPEVRAYMASLYKEAFDLFDSNIVHIGGDEYFQTKNFEDPEGKLAKWAQAESGNPKADQYDALRLFLNEMAEPFLAEGKTVFVWNDNLIGDSKAIIPLDKRITVDVWAGTIYGSTTAKEKVNQGYKVVGSASDLYHDLWPENDKLDRPLPEKLYNEWFSSTYSRGFNPAENLTDQELLQSKGQFFPIWDDANGFAPEYILTKTLYPRINLFANSMWGSTEWRDRTNKPSFGELERVITSFANQAEASIQYTDNDVRFIKDKINEVLNANEQQGTAKARAELKAYLAKMEQTRKTNNKKIFTAIRLFENLGKDAGIKQATVTVRYEDTRGHKLLADVQLKGNIGDRYQTERKDISGYSLKKVIGQASGKFKHKAQTITYVYAKNPERAGNVTVTYQDKNGKTLAKTEILTGNVGERYHVKAKNIKGYKLISHPKNVKGSFTKKEQNVRFIYQYHKNNH